MKLTKDAGNQDYLNADKFQQGDIIDLDISLSAGNIEVETAQYDDGSMGKRLKIPVIHETHIKQVSVSKSVKNDLIDTLGDDTDKWNGAHIQLMVVEYAQIGHKGFVLRKQGCRPAQPQQAPPNPQTGYTR